MKRNNGFDYESVLVTGGAGFIGSHIATALAASGRCVEVIDDLSAGDPSRVPSGVRLHLGDVRSEADLARVFASCPFETIVHCAAQTSVERSMKEPELDRDINVGGTRRLSDFANGAGVKRIVFASSGGAIYGDSRSAASESTRPAPRSNYGRHKLEAERLLLAGGVPCAALRFSNVYGPGQRADAEGGVVAIFLDRLAEGEPLDVHGDGRQVRDFVHVSDVVNAVLLALEGSLTGVWNVASGEATSIRRLVEELAALAGQVVQVRRLPRRPGDVGRSLLDPRKLVSIGWGPPLPLVEGLRLTMESSRIAAPAATPAIVSSPI